LAVATMTKVTTNGYAHQQARQNLRSTRRASDQPITSA
jgi:hypothetical protein